tara:strand:+ start:2416 stop:2682 length:267 start_codon:yes stop_codon:yes gene_type:complete
MKKEFKYFIYVSTLSLFIIFIFNYYFSDKNKKNFFRSSKIYDNEILKYSKNLKTLDSDTENIIEYVENTLNKDKKKYKFWELLFNNEE